LDRAVGRVFKGHEGVGATRRVAPTRWLKRLHPAIRREVILKILKAVKGDLKRFTAAHVASVLEILESPESPLELHLPSSLRVRKTRKTLVITQLTPPKI
jgi:hypothetical protein